MEIEELTKGERKKGFGKEKREKSTEQKGIKLQSKADT